MAPPAAMTLGAVSWTWKGRSFAQCESSPTVPRGNRQQFEGIKQFRSKLANGETLVGIGISMSDPMSADALADCSDFLWFDLEHVPISISELKVHMMVAHGKGCPCMVRVPGPNRVDGIALPWGMFIKQALDANADMIAVPQVRTADDVRSIVADCRYPRGGFRPPPYNEAQPSTIEMPYRFSRGFGPTIPMNYGRIPMPEYLEGADKNIFVCAVIETVEALENLDEIASVPGLDCLILGANDLSAALGVPYQNEHPLTAAATDKIIAAGKKTWEVCNVQHTIPRRCHENC
jgi:2-keto-3-deoxy-L-rhamnonate aldolase RhmA